MVPNGWVEGKIKSLVKSLDAGVSVNSEDDGNLNSEFKILKTSCVSGDSFDPTKVKSVVKQNEIERLKEPVLSDSIIISRMNTPALVGANGYVEHEIANTYLPDRLWQLKPHKDKVCMRWLGYWFASSPTRHKLGSTATGTSGSMKNITKADVLNISINIPPLPEQQKIAKILTTWDKAIDTTERLIDNSKQHKKALMQQLLTGKKRLLDDNGKPFEGEWEEVKLGDISNITTGSSNRADSSLDAEYAFFDRSLDVRRSSIYLFDSEAVIVAGEGQEFVPKYFIGKFDLHQRTYAIMDFKNAVGKFLYYYITFNRHYFLAQAVGSTVKSLRLPMFVKMPIQIPAVEEQQKIAAVLTNADKEIELLEQQLADLQQEKKALMQVLLTGKKRVVVDG